MKFTIVTVCYKNPDELEKTLISIKEQKSNDIELIVVDGGMDQETQRVCNNYKSIINICISEPDNGVYDAMNKGIINSIKGEFILFMNSGDVFANKGVLNDVNSKLNTDEVSIAYGDSISDYGYKRPLRKAPKTLFFMTKKFYSLGFSHQSVFVNRKLFKENLFDTSYGVAADFNFLYPLLRKYNNKLLNLNLTVSTFSTGGISDIDKTRLNNEKRKIYFNNNPFNFSAYLFFNKLVFLEKIKRILRPILRKCKV